MQRHKSDVALTLNGFLPAECCPSSCIFFAYSCIRQAQQIKVEISSVRSSHLGYFRWIERPHTEELNVRVHSVEAVRVVFVAKRATRIFGCSLHLTKNKLETPCSDYHFKKKLKDSISLIIVSGLRFHERFGLSDCPRIPFC